MTAVEAALAARLNAEITGLRRLSGGASRETWSFDADGRALILRRDPPGSPDPTAMAREAALLASAADAGVPVPALADHGDDLPRLAIPDHGAPTRRNNPSPPPPRRPPRPGPRTGRDPGPPPHDATRPGPPRRRPAGRPHRALHELRTPPRRRTGPSLAERQPSTSLRPSDGRPRRLPQRQPDDRRHHRPRRPRLGADPPGRPGRRPGLALHQSLALRLPAPRRRLRPREDLLADYASAGGTRPPRKNSTGGRSTAPSAGRSCAATRPSAT